MRLIIVSNRAPVSVINENGTITYKKSEGGLASGLRAYVDHLKKTRPDMQIIWIGWPGVLEGDEIKISNEILEKFGVQSVLLSEQVMENFYQGFCNKTLWPLFHYFPTLTSYESKYWEEYISVNKIFCQAILKSYQPGDILWIHDYHLMLLPSMIRDNIPDASITFFLHIPFPSFEVFRLLPSDWRKQILEGLYGSDLIGFHTFDYRTYFLRSTLNILGLTDHMGEVIFKNRLVKIDSFPMGIDYDNYYSYASKKPTENEKLKIKRNFKEHKFILSIDRQDYTKGILNRLRAYEHFLNTNPDWKNKVSLLLIVVPSRIGVESYQSIKSNIDELVGHINGTYGTLEWQPIHYQYRSLTFPELVALYNFSDVALITPLRDGMNLIAKEFVASRTNHKGVLILSEMTGAAQELDEAIIINPNNIEEISHSLTLALEMDDQEQKRRLISLQRRVKLYDLFKWANDILSSLHSTKQKQNRLKASYLDNQITGKIIHNFLATDSRVLFLDYDGTLTEHGPNPSKAVPDKELLEILEKLTMIDNTSVVLISGRNKKILETWFGHLNIDIIAEHGVIFKEKNKNWRLLKPVRKNWKHKLLPVLNEFVEKLPGSFVEEKEYSLAFHYRKSPPAFADLRVKELMNHMINFTSNLDVQLVAGNKVLEIRNSGIDKGVAAMNWMNSRVEIPHFILAIGNDLTDEDLFRSLPGNAFTILVGTQPSYAKYNLQNTGEVRMLLNKLVKASQHVVTGF